MRAGRTIPPTISSIASLNMERPKLPAPHQIAANSTSSSSRPRPTSKRSLVYHGCITLQETLIGFVVGAALGIGLAVIIVSDRAGSNAR